MALSLNKKLLLALLIIGMISLVAAEINNYNSYKKDTCVILRQTCASCTYVNVSVAGPSNGSLILSNAEMNNNGGGTWTYQFCNTSVQGRYDVMGSGDLEGTPTGFDVLYFDINEYGIAASLFALYTILYLILLFSSYLFFYKFATYNGGKVKDPNLLFWAGFFDIILFVIIEIYGFGGVDTLIVDVIKMLSLASGIYFWAMAIIGVADWKKKY